MTSDERVIWDAEFNDAVTTYSELIQLLTEIRDTLKSIETRG